MLTLSGDMSMFSAPPGRTTIETKPLDVMVYEGTEAKFTCTAATDPEEVAGWFQPPA